MGSPSPTLDVVAKKPGQSPSTPTRTRRRIIGGVVRAPAMQLDLDFPTASPDGQTESSSVRKRHSKSSKKTRETPKAFRLDLGDSVEETRSRPSSLTRGYDTLGVHIHSIS